MPETPRPSSSSIPETEPGELNFAEPLTERPRMKRRSLKPQPVSSQPPAEAVEPTPDEETSSGLHAPLYEETKTEPAPAASPTGTEPAKSYFRTTVQPTPTHPAQPSTLYYNTGGRKEKEETPPMKPTSASGTSSAHPAAAARTMTAPSTGGGPTRATSVVDYRANIERQAREQKATGNIIHYAVCALGAVLLLGFVLAGYGAYTLSRQIHAQSVTMSDLDARYAAANKALNAHLSGTDDNVSQLQADLNRQQELILKDQEAINKLMTANETLAAALRQERASRAEETSNLRSETSSLRAENANLRTQVRVLEEQPHFQ
jgi:hypothetical protein